MSGKLPVGAYDQLITAELAEKLEGLPAERILREALGQEVGSVALARHLYFLILRSLRNLKDTDNSLLRLEVSNQIIQAVSAITNGYVDDDDLVIIDDEPILAGVLDEPTNQNGLISISQPKVPLSQSALLVNGFGQPSIGNELKMELSSANNVDVIMSFLKMSGLAVIEKQLSEVIRRGGNVRVLTTTYTGATERKAVDRLCNLGAKVKISFDGTGTRLHAKAWILKRDSGSTTGYVGSSNLSGPAMTTGAEWNLRISNREQPHIISDLCKVFEESWEDCEYTLYDPEKDGPKLEAALGQAKNWGKGSGVQLYEPLFISYSGIEIEPRPFQQEVLDALESERTLHGRTRNLVVMATGTGKTVVSALDFKRLHHSGRVKSFLFVAHRQEILKQAQAVFRAVLKSGTFGELFVDGNKPEEWRFVFASVQSLTQRELSEFDSEQFDMIIVDEFHHYPASSYVKFLSHFTPKYLLGLTATPERSDGKELLELFDGVFAAELRLWEAIDRQVLAPFQYFGIHDNVDVGAKVSWSYGRYVDRELSEVYTGNHIRVGLILQNVEKYVADLHEMKAIGFCVDVAHARFMAESFTAAGVPSRFVVGETPSNERDEAILALKSGEIKVIFAVDIYNEGVDIPEVNTLLMLRPTESGVVFIQQLGRGLRKTPTKDCLLVLDFVGNQNKKFRFEAKFGKLLGIGKNALVKCLESGFPQLPSGCHFELDAVASAIVIENLKASIGFSRKQFKKDIVRIGDVGIEEFINDTGVSLSDLYGSNYTFTLLKKLAFQVDYEPTQLEKKVGSSMKRMLHLDDEMRLKAISDILNGNKVDDIRLQEMFASLLLDVDAAKVDYTDDLNAVLTTEFKDELRYLVRTLRSGLSRITHKPTIDVPLQVHGRYTRSEVYAAFGASSTGKFGKGVEWVQQKKADLAFVTIQKSESKYSSTTMYADSAISSNLFQWESQSTTSEVSPTGQRYINHRAIGSTFHLFVREHEKDTEVPGRTMPFTYLGTCNYLSHTGSKPLRILWSLDFPIPADVLVRSKILAS